MKPEKHSERRDAILLAAGKVFTEKGIDGATTLDIAKAAGISKRDLYALFPSKDLILTGMIAQKVAHFAAPIVFTKARSRGEVLATLDGFGRGFLAFLLEPGATSLYRLAIATADRLPAVGKALLSAGIDGTVNHVRTYVEVAIAAGHLRIPSAELDVAVRAYFNAAIGHLQMRRLLDPTSVIGPAEIGHNVKQAVRVLLSFEQN